MVSIDGAARVVGPAAPRGRMTFMEAMEQLGQAQKPGYGVPAYMRWVNRSAARPLAAAGYVLHATPNMMTAASAVSSLLGLVVLVTAGPGLATGIAAAILLAFGFALDSADGQLARLTRAGSPAGEWLDHVVDAVRTPAIHLTVLLLLLARFGWTPYLAVPVIFCLSAVGLFMSQILAEQLRRQHGGAAVGTTPASNARSFALLPVDTGTLCWVFVLWGSPLLFGLAYGFLALAQLGMAGLSMHRKYMELSRIQTGKEASA